MDYLKISNVSANPTQIDPIAGEQATINYTLNLPADVVVRLYHSVTKALVRTLTQLGQLAGANSALWDARDSAGNPVSPEAYYFTIQAADAAGRSGMFNDPVSPAYGPTSTGSSNHTVQSSGFDPYRNDQTTIGFDMDLPGRMGVLVMNSAGAAVRELLASAPVPPGHTSLTWDGRKTNGTFHTGSFSIFFSVVSAIQANPIIVRPSALMAQNLRTEAYLIQPNYGEVSQLNYTLPMPAIVTITLRDPNGNHFRTLLNQIPQLAGSQTVEWDGANDAGLLPTLEGSYDVQIDLLDPTSGLSAQQKGVVTVYR
ncbi:MAG: hypothetical protein HYY57_02820 [Candidatus Omnitrophica bacterium]|nr:hypothetical protein [Candidatus Omnitrophota bacterium]